MKRMKRAIVVVTVTLALTTESTARAEPTATDKAAAESLYDDAKALMRVGRYAEACPKLTESQRLDPGVGTLFYLADCYQRLGKLASAWATWREASAAAHASGQVERENLARSKADALAADVPRLVVRAPSPVPGLGIKRDGAALPEASWGTATLVDPGEHIVEASAPGHQPFQRSVNLAKGDQIEVEVPALAASPAPAPEPPPPTSPPPPPDDARSKIRMTPLTWIGFGVGAAGLVTGTIAGALSFSSASAAKEHCTGNDCTPEARPDIDASRTTGTVAEIAFVVAAVGAGVGVVSLLLPPSKKSTATVSAPSARVLLTAGGLSIRGGF